MDDLVAALELSGFPPDNPAFPWETPFWFDKLVEKVPGLPLDQLTVAVANLNGPYNLGKIHEIHVRGRQIRLPEMIRTVRITRFEKTHPALYALEQLFREQGILVIEVDGHVVGGHIKDPCDK